VLSVADFLEVEFLLCLLSAILLLFNLILNSVGDRVKFGAPLYNCTTAFPTQKSSSLSRSITCSHKQGSDDRVTAVYLFHQEWKNCHPKHACPEAEGSIPTTGLNLLWALNPFRGNSNYWQVSQEETGRIISNRRLQFINSFFYYFLKDVLK
jgi:hypothetical protein